MTRPSPPWIGIYAVCGHQSIMDVLLLQHHIRFHCHHHRHRVSLLSISAQNFSFYFPLVYASASCIYVLIFILFSNFSRFFPRPIPLLAVFLLTATVWTACARVHLAQCRWHRRSSSLLIIKLRANVPIIIIIFLVAKSAKLRKMKRKIKRKKKNSKYLTWTWRKRNQTITTWYRHLNEVI